MTFTAILLVVSLSSCSLFDIFRRKVADKDELYENMSDNGGFDTVAEYLYDWEFPTFDAEKFLAVELCVERYFYGELPSAYQHAKAAASLFLDHYYDKIDLYSKTTVTDSLLYCYTAALGDPYAVYRNKDAYSDFSDDMSGGNEFVGVGVRVRMSEEGYPYVISALPNSPAERAGIGYGHVITGVDGVVADGTNYEMLVSGLAGPAGTSVTVDVKEADGVRTYVLERTLVPLSTVTYRYDETSKIGVVEILSFKERTTGEFKAAIDSLVTAGAEGIVFDLRNNLGGILSVVVDMIAYLADDGLPVVSYQYKGKAETVLDTGNDGHTVKLPMAVLVNEFTASAAEIFAAALRDYELMGTGVNMTTVGAVTYGKGVMQRVYTFVDGTAIAFTVAYYDPPLGVNYHGVGIVPDVSAEDRLTVAEGDSQMNVAFDAMAEMLAAA